MREVGNAMAAAYWMSVFASPGVVRVVPTFIHPYNGEGCGLRVIDREVCEPSQIDLARELVVVAQNREPVPVSRSGLIFGRHVTTIAGPPARPY